MSAIRIGVIGLGWFGEIHCETIVGVPSLELAALCTRRPDRLKQQAAKFGVRKTYADYRDMLADPEIDAVSVVTMWDQHTAPAVAALEAELPQVTELSHRCNGWEMRWFIRTMRERDAGALSRNILERAQRYEDMTLTDHRADLKERARVRAVHAELAANCDACITLSAPNHAPEGLGSTGNPEFGVPSSLLGVPSLSLPLFEVDAMPLGLQVIGYFDGDADAFAIASWLMRAH